MKVPTYERQVSKQEPGVSTPQVAPISQAAGKSAVDLAGVPGDAGKVLGGLGDKIAARAIERQQMEDEKQVLQASNQYQLLKQDTLNSTNTQIDKATNAEVPVGLLSRKLGQAKGAVVEYDKTFAQQKKAFLSTVPGEKQKAALAKLLDQDYISTREQIIRHETQESNREYELVAKASIDTQVLSAAGMKSPEMVGAAITTATGIQAASMARLGAPPEVVKLQAQNTVDQIVASAVEGNLEMDPITSQRILDAHKSRVSAQAAVKMQNVIEGKLLDARRTEAWNMVSNVVNADGTVDLTRAEAQTKGWLSAQKLPAGQGEQIMGYVRQQASIQDAALKDRREARTRSFFNDALEMKNAGRDYNTVANVLFKQKGYGFDNLDREEKTRQLQALFTRSDDFYDAMVKAQTPQQKAAWDDIENMANAKFPKGATVKLEGEDFKREKADVFLNEMMRKVLGQPPEQMRKIAVESLKEIVISPWYEWGGEKRGVYQLSAEFRAGEELKTAQLQDAYGLGAVDQARRTFARAGLANPTAKDLRDLIERKKK